MIVAVVPAYNEAKTIRNVVEVLLEVSELQHVLVIDDGSSDSTSREALQAGAEVIRLETNVGKGQAMKFGMEYYETASAVLFCDSDLVGLRPHHIQDLLDVYHQESPGQAVGLRSHSFGSLLIPAAAVLTDLISGERIVRKSVLQKVPNNCWNGYSIETAINYTVDSLGSETVVVPMKGLSVRAKEEKDGFIKGAQKNFKMFRDIEYVKNSLKHCGHCGCPPRNEVHGKWVGGLAVAGTSAHRGIVKALELLKGAV